MKHIILSLLLVLVWNLDAAVQVPVIWGANTANTSNSLLVSGEVNIYDAGGTTPRTIWTDKDETSAAANPYTLDARGSALLYTTSGWIHILVTDSAGTTVYDHDNILAGALPDLTGTGAYVISVKGDANDSYVKFDAASTDDYYLGTNTSLAGLVIRNLTDGLNAAWWDGAGNFVINENKEIQTATVTEYSATSDLTLSTTNASVVVKSATANVSNTGNVWVSNNVVIGEAWSAAPSNTLGSTDCLIMGTSNTAYQANNIICGTGNNVENISANYSLILGDSNENKGLEGSIIAGSRNNIFGNSNEGCLVVGYNNYAFGVCPSSANQIIMLGRNNLITSTGPAIL